MGRSEEDAYRRGLSQSARKDSGNWLRSPNRTDAEKQAFTRGVADDLRPKKQTSSKHKVKQHTRETPKGKKTRVKEHNRESQGGSSQNGNSRSGSGQRRPSSSRNGTGPERRPPAKKKTKQKQQTTPLLHPARSKRYLKKAFNLRTSNGRKATGYAAAALVTGLAYFMVQIVFFGFAALAFIAALAGTLLDEVTK